MLRRGLCGCNLPFASTPQVVRVSAEKPSHCRSLAALNSPTCEPASFDHPCFDVSVSPFSIHADDNSIQQIFASHCLSKSYGYREDLVFLCSGMSRRPRLSCNYPLSCLPRGEWAQCSVSRACDGSSTRPGAAMCLGSCFWTE